MRVESTHTALGVIRHGRSFVTVELAEDDKTSAAVRRFAEDLERAGVTVRVSHGAATVMWSKLAFLTALALLTTAAQVTACEVCLQRRGDLVAMVGEIAAVAQAEGAEVQADNVVAFFDGIPACMRLSMQRDAEAGNRLELDAIGERPCARPGGTTSRYRSPAATPTSCVAVTRLDQGVS